MVLQRHPTKGETARPFRGRNPIPVSLPPVDRQPVWHRVGSGSPSRLEAARFLAPLEGRSETAEVRRRIRRVISGGSMDASPITTSAETSRGGPGPGLPCWIPPGGGDLGEAGPSGCRTTPSVGGGEARPGDPTIGSVCGVLAVCLGLQKTCFLRKGRSLTSVLGRPLDGRRYPTHR